MKRPPKITSALVTMAVAAGLFASSASAQAPAAAPVSPQSPVHKFKATDADNHNILINHPGAIVLVLGTNQDSQDAARSAGESVYPFRGRPDFDLVVVVDLRDSIAAWAPSIVLSEMRSSLDKEAAALKPWFLKNGNTSNPRNSAKVIADFNGTICPDLGWKEHSDNLRGILFGADGREIKRWDKLEDMPQMQADVRAAIEAYDKASAAKAGGKTQGTKLLQPPNPPPPLPPANKPGSN